jgi:hypothetical protein
MIAHFHAIERQAAPKGEPFGIAARIAAASPTHNGYFVQEPVGVFPARELLWFSLLYSVDRPFLVEKSLH